MINSKKADILIEFTESLKQDKKFFSEDIQASIAHSLMLYKCNIISKDEKDKIVKSLKQIKDEILKKNFNWNKNLEDVHMNIEKRLIELIGDTGKKLHSARSRNDQVVTDFRLYVNKKILSWQKLLLNLIKSLNELSKKNIYQIMPGFTHFQPSQPISLAHHLLAYLQMLKRDYQRIEDAKKRVMILPLGACALAGTTHKINPNISAKILNFTSVFKNSIDAVSDRDFVCETIFCATQIMMHISRFCEDIIYWANPAFGFITIGKKFSTGSSIMPQKQNPDIAELARGKTGIVYGNLMAILTLMKGLPLAYNRDMQEDKTLFVQTTDQIELTLTVINGLLKEIRFNKDNMLKSMKIGYLNATELADYLVKKNISFRKAYNIATKIVTFAKERKLTLEEIKLETLKSFSTHFEKDIFADINYYNAVKKRTSHGGTGFEQIKKQIIDADRWIKDKNRQQKEN